MATKKPIKKPIPKKTKAPEAIVVNQITISAVDRSQKDIEDVRNAQRASESVSYPNRSRLYDLYDDVMLDGHLSGIWKKRVDAVLNKNLHYEDTSGKRVEEMDKLIESETFRDLQTKLLEREAWGLTGIEFIPGDDFAWEEIPRKHIKPDIKIIAKEQNSQDGFPYEESPFLWVLGGKNDFGFLLKCSFYAIYKRGNMGDWGQYIEIFGQPVRIIKYDAFDLKTKKELQTVLDESGSSLAVLIPKQADFEMLDAKTSNGDGQLQERFKDALNAEMSLIVLTATETATSSKSSGYAQSQTHGEQQLEVTKSDLKNVQNMLNSPKFQAIIRSYGFPEGRFVFEKELDISQLKDRVAIDAEVSTKVPVGDDYWYDTYGIPKPSNYDELKKKMEAEKQMKLNPPAPGMPPGNKPTKNKKPKPANLSADESFWNKLRSNLADFFDPARVK